MAGDDTAVEEKFFDSEFFLKDKIKISKEIQVIEGLFKLALIIQQVVQVKKRSLKPRPRIQY